MTLNKQALRIQLRAQRAALPQQQRRANDAVICTALAQHKALTTFRTVGFYAASNAEPDLRALATQWQTTKRLALPVVDADTLVFCRWQPEDALVTGKFNIAVPATRQVIIPDAQMLLLLPCLALDRYGNRLGYGGGYYDRFLAANPTVTTVGVCYQCCLQTQLPRHAHDRSVDYIVTETGLRMAVRR